MNDIAKIMEERINEAMKNKITKYDLYKPDDYISGNRLNMFEYSEFIDTVKREELSEEDKLKYDNSVKYVNDDAEAFVEVLTQIVIQCKENDIKAHIEHNIAKECWDNARA